MSCLFQSLSSFIRDSNPHQLRQVIVDYIEKNPKLDEVMDYQELIKHEFGPLSLQNYCQRMRFPSTWGGAIEIRAFCDMFDAEVHVRVLQTGKVIEFKPSRAVQPPNLFFLSWNGGHYEPIQK